MNGKVRSLGWAFVGLLVAVLVVVAFASLLVTTSNTKAIKDTQQSIRSCTTPGQECYDRGQEQTSKAIADINRVTVYAAACADEPGVQGQAEIYSCVIDRLASDQPD